MSFKYFILGSLDNGRVVKGIKFLNIRDAGDPVEIAKSYESARRR